MPPLKTYTFKYLNTDIELTIKAWKPSEAYSRLQSLVSDESAWLEVI
jgi:hypothetical protein